MAGTKIQNMEEFANLSGISRPTVSKYFNDPDSVRASTRVRIEAALERHEYRPNIYAMNQNRNNIEKITTCSDILFAAYGHFEPSIK
jgi:DNA-binding LacI/PurR family transcriptional regulator